jgi:ParB-like chromosome segregation protein Spo0J
VWFYEVDIRIKYKGGLYDERSKKDIQDLIPSKYNPRKSLKSNSPEYKRIKASIEKFGYVDPIIINVDNTVIGGHQRLKVLKDLGYDNVDVIEVDLNKDDEKALNIALNKISGQ